MLIDVIVGSSLLLFGGFTVFWLRSAALRARIEAPKHRFLEYARRQDGAPHTAPILLRDEGNRHP